jgi:hypothetical protein
VVQRSALLDKLPVTLIPAAVSDHHGISKLYLSDAGIASDFRFMRKNLVLPR